MLGRPPVGVKAIVTALVALSMTGGCSFLFVQPPKDDYPGRGGVINCTTSPVAPVVDTLFTLTNLFSVFYVANEDNVTNKGTAVGLGLSVAAIWLSSAIYGYYNTSQCADLTREDDEGHDSRRPVHFQNTGYRPPPRALPPPSSEPASPGAPQQQDDDEDARQAGRQRDADAPAPGMAPQHTGGSGRPDLTPRFGN